MVRIKNATAMPKRSIIDEDSDGPFEDPKDIIKEKKLKKKKIEEPQPSTSKEVLSFDEVLKYKEDPAEKFTRMIRLSKTDGIGMTNNSFAIFRIIEKDKVETISNYQFTMKYSVIPNLIQALEKIKAENAK
jgi:hypothetical protein